MKHLHRLFLRIRSDAVGSKTDIIEKTYALCPSLRVIHVQDPLEVRQTVYGWEERSKSWVLSPGYRDIWAEAVRGVDVCVDLIPGGSILLLISRIK
jgi:hypothetical protein